MTHHFEHKWKIQSKTSLLNLKLKGVWEYRDLLILFVRRDFVSFYKQTILGPLWFFIQPLLQTLMFTFIFGRLAGISTDGISPVLFYLSGVTLWNYFSDCLLKTSGVFRDNAYIFGKVYFPRLIMPLSIVISSLIRFGIQMILFICAVLFYLLFKNIPLNINSYAFLFPVLVILMAAMALGAGMIVSALTTKYRDLAFLISFGIQLLMYATTVIYPLSKTKPDLRPFIVANPMTSIIETFRFGFLGKGTFNWSSLGYSIIVTVVMLLIGTIIFNKVEKDFIDTV